MTEIRNLLIVGRTGNGKSSLANNLVNKDGEFKEVFKESSRSISSTKEAQREIFEWNGLKYNVVDTIGLNDTKLSNKEVLYNIAKTIGMMKEGISHVLFVISDKFTEEERKNFRILKDVMFESKIFSYVTIVRTKFDQFQDEEECELDKQDLLSESEDVAEIIKVCNGLIHVDNPSLKTKDESEITSRKKRKGNSREKLLSHLKSNYRGNYKLNKWDEIYLRINNYLNSSNKKEEEKMLVVRETLIVLQEEAPTLVAQQEVSSNRCCIIS